MFKRVRWVLAILALTLMANGCGYNALQQMEEGVFRAWSDVESNLQRRADLIPNLVATVKATPATSSRPSRRWSRPAPRRPASTCLPRT